MFQKDDAENAYILVEKTANDQCYSYDLQKDDQPSFRQHTPYSL